MQSRSFKIPQVWEAFPAEKLRFLHDGYMSTVGLALELFRSSEDCRRFKFFEYVWVPEVGNTADTLNPPWLLPLLKEIWQSPRVKENLTSVGFEPTTSGLDLPML